jgi:hypothetical protein
MLRTKPFAELEATVLADPERRARVEAAKRAMEDALAQIEPRARRQVTQHNAVETVAASDDAQDRRSTSAT